MFPPTSSHHHHTLLGRFGGSSASACHDTVKVECFGFSSRLGHAVFFCIWHLFIGQASMPWYSLYCWLGLKHQSLPPSRKMSLARRKTQLTNQPMLVQPIIRLDAGQADELPCVPQSMWPPWMHNNCYLCCTCYNTQETSWRLNQSKLFRFDEIFTNR